MESTLKINVTKQAKVSIHGQINPGIEELWIVLHGYGQLSQYFIRSFSPISSEQRLIVAPEGLHRFYVNGFSGRVGASWMTKEERLDDIQDYLNYLDQLIEELEKEGLPNSVRINLLGFSQGAATACRWLFHTSRNISSIILWSGMVPPDLDIQVEDPAKWRNAFLVYDSNDRFHHTESFQKQLRWLDENQLNYTLVESNSGHSVDESSLNKLIQIME